MISAVKLRDKLFKPEDYPYRIYERKITSLLKRTDTLCDAGYGESAPLLRKFSGGARRLLGVDLKAHPVEVAGVEVIRSDISRLGLKNESVDLVISRSVLEHLPEPLSAYRELNRILKPGGSFVFIVPNAWHYASILSRLITDRYHGPLVSRFEGRREKDVFPAYYKSNTYSRIRRLSQSSGFEIAGFQYLDQYPYYFMFSAPLFLLAAIYVKLVGRFRCLRFLRADILVHLVKR